MPKGVYERTPEILLSLGMSRKGRKFTPAHKQAIADGHKGLGLSSNTKVKIGLANKGKQKPDSWVTWWVDNIRSKQIGDKSPHYKGGITPLSKIIRDLKKYDEWRLSVYQRDNFTCKKCGRVGGRLNAHHKKPFAQILQDNNITNYYDAINCDELWDVDNGITLCEHSCHIINRRGNE